MTCIALSCTVHEWLRMQWALLAPVHHLTATQVAWITTFLRADMVPLPLTSEVKEMLYHDLLTSGLIHPLREAETVTVTPFRRSVKVPTGDLRIATHLGSHVAEIGERFL